MNPFRFLRIVVFLFGMTGFMPAKAALFEHAASDLQAEAQAAGREGKHLAVLLTLPDCSGCRDMEKHVYRDAGLESVFNSKFRSVRLDIGREAALIEPSGKHSTPVRFAARLRAFGTPSFLFFDAQGQVLYRHVGKLDRDDFERLASYVSEGEYEYRPFQPTAAADMSNDGPARARHRTQDRIRHGSRD